jgi:hypothetical protein
MDALHLFAERPARFCFPFAQALAGLTLLPQSPEASSEIRTNYEGPQALLVMLRLDA